MERLRFETNGVRNHGFLTDSQGENKAFVNYVKCVYSALNQLYNARGGLCSSESVAIRFGSKALRPHCAIGISQRRWPVTVSKKKPDVTKRTCQFSSSNNYPIL